MMKRNKEVKDLSRRDFIKTTAVGVGATALAGVGAVKAQDAEITSTRLGVPTRWDYEADVVVVGHGFAAQAAAIEADRAGVSVLMLEKAPEKHAGGNSRVCGQGFIAPSPAIWDAYYTYLNALTAGQGFPINPDKATADAHIRFYIQQSSQSIKWFEDMGATVIPSPGLGIPGAWIPFYPHMPGADALATETTTYRVGGNYSGAGGNWYFLEDQIRERKGIKSMYETQVKRLVQDPQTKEILGVVALSLWEKYPREICVKANRAVCVCNGGWEFNQKMVRDFQHVYANYSLGSPYNTGDGIRMCWAVGADLRNMGVNTAPALSMIGVRPQWKGAIMRGTPTKGGFVNVCATNKRWRDEFDLGYMSNEVTRGSANKNKAGQQGAQTGVGTEVENGVYIPEKLPNPMFLIFDEEARLSGPLFGGGFATAVEGYVPSNDNSTELANGWFVKADTIDELEKKIGREPDPLFGRVPLAETVARWNEMCAGKKDLDWGRVRQLDPIKTPPYYAVEFFQGVLNTQGGMVRNTKSQVLDIEGNPIPRLYSAGENGDIWTVTYQCMSNVGGGCYGYGRVAGTNAAAEEPWS
jgi:hypothetical protein